MVDNQGAGGGQQPHPYWSQHGSPAPGPMGQGDTTAMPTTVGGPPPPENTQKKSGRGPSWLLALGLVFAMLVAGGIGGVIGAGVAGNDSAAGGDTGITRDVNPSQPVSEAPDGTAEAVAGEVLPSVVSIQVMGQGPLGQGTAGGGSGIVISEEGHILTNAHVVAMAANQGQSAIRVLLSDGSSAEAEIVGLDTPTDVAVIRAETPEPLTPVDIGTSENLNVGQPVVAIGSPLGLSGTVTTGIISALDRPVRAGGAESDQSTVIDAVQTDAAINPGNSGGALVNMNGDLIGVNSAIASLGGAESGSIGLGFAIPVDQAMRVADQLIADGAASQAILGVSVMDADAGVGALVGEVPAGGPADEAGIPQGAVITGVDDRRIDGGDDLVAAIRSQAPGDRVAIEYALPDSTDTETVEVTLGETQ